MEGIIIQGLKSQEYIENGIITIVYSNEKKLEIGDFIDSMNKDLLKVISKNYGFLDKDSWPVIEIIYSGKNDGEIFEYYCGEDDEMDFDEGFILPVDVISEILMENANEIYYDNYQKQKYLMRVYHLENGYEEDEYVESDEEDEDEYYSNNTNDFIINSIKITLYKDSQKVLHKKKFYNDLHNDLVAAAWHPSRVLDWCIDFQELRYLKKRWGVD